MIPTLQPGDEVIIDPVSPDALHQGDLVVVRKRSQGLLHRYLGKWRGRIMTKGDGHRYLDPLWDPEDVLGRAVEVWRDAECVYRWTRRLTGMEWLKAQWHRTYGGLWYMLRALKGCFLALSLLLLCAFPVLAAVTLTDFSVVPGEQEIFVYWETASETGNLGFYVWRSEEPDAGYEKLPLDNPDKHFIPSVDEGVGAFYEYMDTEVTPGVVYYYKVQDVPDDGSQGEYTEVKSATIEVPTETPTDTPTPTPTQPLTSTPEPETQPKGSPQILFWASETTLDAGDCSTVQWQTENVASVYFDGEGVAGQGARTFCPCEDETHVLTVYLRGGGTEERVITLETMGTCSGQDSPIPTPTLAPRITPSLSPQATAEIATVTPTPSPELQTTVVVPTVTPTPTRINTDGVGDDTQLTPSFTATPNPTELPTNRTVTLTVTPMATRAVVEGGSSKGTRSGNRALILGVSGLFGLVLVGGGIFLWKRWQ